MSMRTLSVTVLFVSAAAPSSCSLIFVDGPPPKSQRSSDFDCSREAGLPEIADMAIATFEVVRAAYAYSQPDSAYQNPKISRGADIMLGASLALLAGGSAIAGFTRVSDCKEAIAEATRPDWTTTLRARRKPARAAPAFPAAAPLVAAPQPAADPSPPPETPNAAAVPQQFPDDK